MTKKNKDLEYALDTNGSPTDVLVGCIRGCDACKREICLLDYIEEQATRSDALYLDEDTELEEEKEMFYGYTTEELDYEE